MKKEKNKYTFRIEERGVSFKLSFEPVSIEKRTGFFVPEGKNRPEFSEYLTSIETELHIETNIRTELDSEFEIKIYSDQLYMDEEKDRYTFEVEDYFDGEENDTPLYLYAREGMKKTKEKIKISLGYEGTTIFEKSFLISIDGSIVECDNFERVPLIEYAGY